MKALIITLVALLTGQFAAAQEALPIIQLSEQALGGAVLMIEMKHVLVVDRSVNERVLNELGENEKKNFFRDMVMSKSPATVCQIYCGVGRPATRLLIEQYEKLLSPPEAVTLK